LTTYFNAITPAGQQGILAGTPQRQVPTTGSPQDELQAFLQAANPGKAVERGALAGMGEGDLNLLAAEASRFGKADHLNVIEKEIADRLTGRRPANPDPSDDLSKAEREGSVFKTLFDKAKDEGGFAMIGHDPNTGSITDDVKSFFDHLGKTVKSEFDIEVPARASRFIRRMISAQELAEEFPAFKPIYDAFHRYPRQASQASIADILPLAEQEGRQVYFKLPAARREAIDKLAILHREARAAQPRMTPDRLKLNGLKNDEEVRIFNEVYEVAITTQKAQATAPEGHLLFGWHLSK